jgi:hypothetical protein
MPFCREKNFLSFETFYATNEQTMKEEIAKHDLNWKGPFLEPKLKVWRNVVREIFL